MIVTKTKNRTLRDLLTVLIMIVLVTILSISIDFIDSLYSFFHIYVTSTITKLFINFTFLLLTGLLWVTYHRWRESAKKQAELESIVDSISPDALIVLDADENIIMCNASVKRMFGYNVDDVLYQKPDLLFDREPEPEQLHEMLPMLEREGFHVGSGMGRKKDGQTTPLQILTGSLSDRGGAVLLLRDITDYKTSVERMERKTFQQEQLLETARYLTESLNLKEVLSRIGTKAREILKAQGCALYFLEDNDKTLKPMVAIDPHYEKEILSTSLNIDASFTGQAVKARCGLIFNNAEADPLGHQIPGTPEEKDERVIVAPFIVEDIVLGTMCLDRIGTPFSEQDLALTETFATYAATALKNAQTYDELQHEVEERQQAEQALALEKAYLEQLFESAPEAIAIVDNDSHILRANSEFTNMFGYTLDEAVGQSIDELLALGDLHNEALLLTRKVARGSRVALETVRQRKDGTLVDVSILGTPIKVDGGQIAVYGIYRDITERKRAEEEKAKLENQLRQSQKMEAVGTLAGGVAHDFNNLLGGIIGYTSLLLSKVSSEDGNRKYLELIEKAGRRAAELTSRLLGFARQGKCEVKPVDVNGLIGGVVQLLSASIDKKIEIKTDLCGENAFTKGDPSQLEQVLMNLCVNARDAMPNGGELSIHSRLVYLDERFVSKHLGARAGDYVCMSVSDTGMGMDEETKAKVFDPFFTTKGQEEGTGLGLSMVYGIVKNHDGYISVYSEIGKGTTFNVYLPLSGRALSKPKRKRRMVKPSSGSGSILVVDDEEIMRDLMGEILGDLGYEVILASNGEEAVKVYGEHQDKIGLVIVDMVMPKMGGKETYEQLRRVDPGIKALLASGYSKNAVVQEILDLGMNGFLHKPFSVEEISRKVREVLHT